MDEAFLQKRFWPKVEKTEDGHWLWRGAKNKEGHGVLRDGHRQVLARHIAYEIKHGPGSIQPGHSIGVTCEHKLCVRDDHLGQLTPEEMKQRRAEGLRRSASLSPEAVANIRERATDAASVADLAATYGVTKQYIYNIRNGRQRAG